MIGNDIIDWDEILIRPKAKQIEYVNRVLCKEEMAVFESSRTPELLLWSFWALKEAAYKAWYKNNHIRFFAPKKYYCRLTDNNKNQTVVVSTPFGLCFGKLYIKHNFIHAVVSTSAHELEHISIHTIPLSNKNPKIQSSEIRTFVTKYIENTYNKFVASVCLSNPKGYLEVFSKNSDVFIDVSISHHGHYGGIVFGKIVQNGITKSKSCCLNSNRDH